MISVNNVLRHYSPNQIETLIIHEHADINKHIFERSKFRSGCTEYNTSDSDVFYIKAVFFFLDLRRNISDSEIC